jgi:hypothetical protein
MLQPSVVTAAIQSAWQSIPALIVQMNGNPANIAVHNYSWGQENSLSKAIVEMPAPSILIAYLKIQGGNFDGESVWKHHIQVAIKSGNVADPNAPFMSTFDVWWLMMNLPVNGATSPFENIRLTKLLNGDLAPMIDLPSLIAHQDEMGDFCVGTLIWPEYGDVGVY